jgi:hypothetical protein
MEAQIKKYCQISFDMTSGSIQLFNDRRSAIRIKYLENYEHLKDIQLFIQEEGVKFLRKEKKVHNNVLIKTDKVFLVKELENGIYLDQEESEIGYITLSKHLKWNEFETITFQVKNNWNGKGFDAATAHFNRHFGIVNVVRVYSKENSFDFLRSIQEVYERFIK